MRRLSRSPTQILSAVLVAAGITAVVQVSLGMPQDAAGSHPATATVPPTRPIEVNRALKGDRLRAPVDVRAPSAPNRPLPDGCESAFGPINPSTKPARCVT
jgi:hypothetical protein